MRGILPLCSVPEGSRPSLRAVTVSKRTTLHTRVIRTCLGRRGPSLAHWPAVMSPMSVIIKRLLCSSVGAISPQDAVAAERDVTENYHLHRPQALECSLVSSPISLKEEMVGGGGWGGGKSTNWELMKSLKEAGGVNYLLESLLGFYLLQ